MSKYITKMILNGEQVGVRVFKKEAPAKRKGQDWYNQYKDKPGIVITVEKEEEDKP